MRSWILAGLLWLTAANSSYANQTFRFYHENVLGTSCELTVVVSSTADVELQAGHAEQTALAEIDRLDAVFSRYRNDSELARFRGSEPTALSAELAEVLRTAEQVRLSSGGAFDVRAVAWQQLDAADPRRASLWETLRREPYSMSDTGVAVRYDDLPISLDAIAKGFILDRVCNTVRSQHPAVVGMVLNIGGDIRKSGDVSLPVQFTNPFHAAEGGEPLDRWQWDSEGAVATSGGYRRHVVVDGSRQSHLIDPRSGHAVSHHASVSVLAPTAVQADAMSTAISVLSTADAVRWVQSFPDTGCLIVTADGQCVTAGQWPTSVNHATDHAADVQLVSALSTDAAAGLHVRFTLNRVENQRYRRPYVAVWLEDKEGFPVKTGLLWLQRESPGPQWHRDLTRWFRNDRLRKISEKIDLIETVGGATRGPGQYEVHFDGTDNVGKPLPAGSYTLYLEVTREHGTYQLIRQPIQWGDQAIAETELKSNEEVSQASFRYQPTAVAEVQ